MIVPYTEVDGIPTFSDSEIRELWERLEREGMPKTFSRSSYFHSSEDFLNEMKERKSLLYIVMEENEIVGVFWLNYFQERFCQIHYWFYRKWWGKTEYLGKKIFSEIMKWELDGIYGIIPEDNILAIKLAKKCGWKEAGTLPFGFYDNREKESKAAVIMYLTKDNLEEVI